MASSKQQHSGKKTKAPPGKNARKRAKARKEREERKNVVEENVVKKPPAHQHELLISKELLANIARIRKYEEKQALSVEKRDCIAILGDAGSGKSTLANYLHGCQMEQVQDVLRVKADSPVPEKSMMCHNTARQNFTLKVLEDLMISDSKPALVDLEFLSTCPTETNIANAMNTKLTVMKAKSLRVLILIDYHTLNGGRANCVCALCEKLIAFFGSKDKLNQYRESVLVCVTKVPLQFEEAKPCSHVDLVHEFFHMTKLDAQTASVVSVLVSSVFFYDPLDRGCQDTFCRRSNILDKLSRMPFITETEGFCSTVLTIGDEIALHHMMHALQEQLDTSMERKEYMEAERLLKNLFFLDRLDSLMVTRLLGSVRQRLKSKVSALYNAVIHHALVKDFDRADEMLEDLQQMVDSLKQVITDLDDVVPQAQKVVGQQKCDLKKLEQALQQLEAVQSKMKLAEEEHCKLNLQPGMSCEAPGLWTTWQEDPRMSPEYWIANMPGTLWQQDYCPVSRKQLNPGKRERRKRKEEANNRMHPVGHIDEGKTKSHDIARVSLADPVYIQSCAV